MSEISKYSMQHCYWSPILGSRERQRLRRSQVERSPTYRPLCQRLTQCCRRESWRGLRHCILLSMKTYLLCFLPPLTGADRKVLLISKQSTLSSLQGEYQMRQRYSNHRFWSISSMSHDQHFREKEREKKKEQKTSIERKRRAKILKMSHCITHHKNICLKLLFQGCVCVCVCVLDHNIKCISFCALPSEKF